MDSVDNHVPALLYGAGHGALTVVALFARQEPQRFVAQMETYFNGLTWHEISADTSGVIADMMEILRKNQARRPHCSRHCAATGISDDNA